MNAYNSFNTFLAENPQWILFISFATPLAVLSVLVTVFDRRRKRIKAVRQAHKVGLIQKRSERHPNLVRSGLMVTKASNGKDVKPDYFDRVNEYYASL